MKQQHLEIQGNLPLVESEFDSTTGKMKSKKISLFNGQIVLNEDISVLNYICAQIQQLIMTFVFTSMDTLQPMILIDKTYYNIDKAHAGATNAHILLYDLPARMVIAPLYGALCDILGRRIMLSYGVISVFIGFMMVPLDTEVFPWYLGSKLLITNGCCALLITPLNADYIDDSTKGRAAGMAYTVGAAGALLGATTIGLLSAMDMSLGNIYWTIGITILVLGLINNLGLKGGNTYYKNKDVSLLPALHLSLLQKFKNAWKEVDKNPWIMIAFILSSLGSADFYIFTTIFVLYLKSFYPNTEAAEDLANSQATLFQSIFFACSLAFCVAYGFLIDRVNHFKLLITILVVTAVGFALVPLVQSPEDPMLMVMLLITSVGLPGVFTFACYSAIRYFPREHRGTLNGIVGVFGVLGVIGVMIAGGYLFDTWHRSGPFVLYDGMVIFSIIAVMYLYLVKIRHTKYYDSGNTSAMRSTSVGDTVEFQQRMGQLYESH
jgi:MFS family permease